MLTCAVLNAQSLGNKLLDLQHLLYTDHTDIIMVTETWLDENVPSGLLDPESRYNIIRKDRNRNGGGVCTCINKRFQVCRVDVGPRFDYLELICFDLLCHSTEMRFFVVYRPPGYGSECVGYLSDVLEFIKLHYKLSCMNIITGDFNCPKINWNDLQCSADYIHQMLFNFVVECGLTQVVTFATRLLNILDIVLIDEPQHILNIADKPPLGHSDHNVVEFSIWLHRIDTKYNLSEEKVCRYMWHRADFESASCYLQSIDWYRLIQISPSPDHMWSMFLEVLNTVIDMFVPIVKTENRNNNKQKHYPRCINKALAKKRHTWKLCKVQPHNCLLKYKYRESSRVCSYLIKEHEKQIEQKVIEANSTGAFYKHVNRRLRYKAGVGPLFDDDGKLVTNDLYKSELLNKYFASVGVTDNGIMPSVVYDTPSNKLNSIIFTKASVLKAMKKLKYNLSSGPDGLPPLFFKKLQHSLAEPLALMYTQLLSVSAVPATWKQAIIVPVFKKGASTNPSNYRPISLTCVTSKIMERVIADNMRDYFLKHNIITTSQHGFLKGLSTCTNLLESFNDWTLSLQGRSGITIAYVDFAKAFDTVSHDKLLHCLRLYGIDGDLLSWLRNFLSQRTLSTRVGNCMSSELELLSGVIQGSGIGPLLFVSYINELAKVLGHYQVTTKFFADDLKMYAEIKTCLDAGMFQCALDKLAAWAVEWQLQISISKCFIMHIGPLSVQRDYFLDGLALPHTVSNRDLGVIVNDMLIPCSHIASVTVTANQRSNLIFRCFVSRDVNLLVRAFITYVRPILEYSSVVWSPHTKGDIECIERVQRRFTKRLPGLKNLTYSQRLKHVNLPSLELRRLHADLLMCYKILFGLVKLSVSDFFIFNPVTVTRGHQYKLYVKHCYGARKHFFAERVVAPWNHLPVDIVDFSSLRRFKCSIKLIDFSKFLVIDVDS